MDNMLGQTMDSRIGTDIYRKFGDADQLIATIHSIYDRRMHDTGTKAFAPAFVMAFVHPELKKLAIRDSAKVATKAVNTLLDTYVPDVDSLPNSLGSNPFIRKLDDIRSGVYYTSLEGQRMGPGEDSGSSAMAARKFADDADRLLNEVETNDKYTTGNRVKTMVSRAAGKADVASMIRDTIVPGTLFGYTMSTVPGKDSSEKAENWKLLQKLEHWYYYAFELAGGDSGKNDCGTDTYIFADVYGKFAAENPDVTRLADALVRHFSEDAIEDGEQGHDSRAISQVTALMAVRPGQMAKAVNELCQAYPEHADDYKKAMEKVAIERKKISGLTSNELDKFKFKDIYSDALAYQHDNSNSADLVLAMHAMENMKPTMMSKPVSNILAKYGNASNDSGAYKFACGLGSIMSQPELMKGLIKDPDDPPDVDSDAETDSVDSNDAALKANTGTENPFDRAIAYLGRNGDEAFSGIGRDYSIPVRELSPESDVTGAIILPEVAIPLFAQKVSYPDTRNADESSIYAKGVSLVTYLAMYLKGNPGGIKVPDWLAVGKTADGETDSIAIRTGQQVDPEQLNTEIQNCFFSFVTGRPANAIEARNKWVECLQDGETWKIIYNALYDYFISQGISDDLIDRLPKIISDIRSHVLRNIFDVKSGSIAYTMPDKQVAIAVKPYDPVNRISNGTLRKTGGIDGSVTRYGCSIIAGTRGKVTSVDGTGPSRKFTVSFGNKSMPADTVSMKDTESWIPPVLINFMDTDNGTNHYAVWVGMQFCSIMSDEGSANTAKIPDEIIRMANESYMDTTGYTGSVGQKDSVTGAMEVTKKLGTTTSAAMRAVTDVGRSIGAEKLARYADMFGKLDSAKKACDASSAAEIDSMLRVDNVKGSTEDIAAAVASKLATGICKKGGADVDSDSYDSMGRIIAYCTQSGVDPRVKMIRALSAMTAILDASGTDDATMVGDHPFACNLGDDKVSVWITDTLTDFSAKKPSVAEYLEYTLMEAKDSLAEEIEYAADADKSALDGYVDLAVNSLRGLQKEYADMMLADSSISNRKAVAAFSDVTDESFVTNLADALREVVPIVKDVPELGKTDVASIVSSVEDVNRLNNDLSKYKTEKEASIYNKETGYADALRIHGDETEDIPGMQPDVLGEGDAVGKAKLSDSIKGDLDDFDARSNANYESVTNYPMLGMVKCDPAGMGSGQDNFDILHGINPTEFEEVAKLLDDSQMYIEDEMGGARGKNIPIREYIKLRSGAINRVIYEFYRLMCDGRRITDTENNILKKAFEVADAVTKVANACQDDSIREELTECASEFSGLVNRVASSIPEQYTSIAEANKAVASYIATGVANIVLYLGSLNVDASVAYGGAGLEQYGQPEMGRLGIGNTGAYSSVHSMKRDASSRMLSTGISTPNRLFLDRVRGGMNGADRFVSTMANFYTTLGMDSTAGYENAINPFEDIAKKLSTKAEMGYRNLYLGEAKTDLGAILVWAINRDEASADEGYPTVGYVINHLLQQKGEQPARLEIPEYIKTGLDVDEGSHGSKKLNLDKRVDVFVDGNGNAISASGMDVPHEILEKIAVFNGVDDIWAATKLPSPAQFDVRPDSTPEELARAVRVSIIDEKLEHGNAINSLPYTEGKTGEKKFEPVVQSTVDNVKAASAMTKGTGDEFVPFSVVYASIDETYLSTAMSQVTGVAHDALTRKGSETTYRDIYRRIYGDDGSENLSSTMEEHRNDIVYALATALGTMEDGKLTFDQREDVLNSQRPVSPDNPDTTVPDSSLNVILGKSAGKFLDMFIRECGDKVDDTTDSATLVNIADAFVNKFFNPAGDLTRIAETLSNIAGGSVEYDRGVEEITSMLGAKNTGIATEIVNRYLQMLGTPDSIGDASRVSEVKRRNVANRIVKMVMGSNSEFRNIYRASHGSDIGDVRQARMVMHGKSPLPNVEKVGGIGGKGKMFSKTADALSGKMPVEDAAEYLSAVKFSIDGVSGEDAIVKFNEIVDRVVKCIKTLAGSTRKGIASKNPTERDANKIGDNAFDVENAGPARKAILEKLADLVESAKISLGLKKPDKVQSNPDIAGTSRWNKNGISDTVRRIVEIYCSWNPLASEDRLAERAEMLKNKNVLETMGNEIKNGFANAFASARLYHAGVEDIANAASMFRGVSGDTKLGIDVIRKILDTISTVPDSPVRKSDSDVVGEYLINGVPMEFEECVGIVNDAVDMYFKTNGVPEGSGKEWLSDDDIKSPDFIECIKRNLSIEKDYGLSTDAIVELFLRNMIADKYLGKSDVLPFGVKKYYRCKGSDGYSRKYKFDIPLDIVRDIINDALRGMTTTASSNQWRQFAEDFAKYTAAANRSRNDEISDPELRNEMVALFDKVAKSLNAKLAKAANNASVGQMQDGRPVADDSGIVVSLPGVAQQEDDLREGDELSNLRYNPD